MNVALCHILIQAARAFLQWPLARSAVIMGSDDKNDGVYLPAARVPRVEAELVARLVKSCYRRCARVRTCRCSDRFYPHFQMSS
jgi:hypothetical protein